MQCYVYAVECVHLFILKKLLLNFVSVKKEIQSIIQELQHCDRSSRGLNSGPALLIFLKVINHNLPDHDRGSGKDEKEADCEEDDDC